jgi:hypothetical protein
VNPRWIAAVLLLAAAGLYVGVARPAQKLAGQAADEYRRARDERREIRSRLTQLERRDAARRRAARVLEAPSASGEEAVRRVRRSVVHALAGVSVGGTRLSVQPGRAPVGARVHLSTEGPFEEILRLCASLARPEAGLILDRVSMHPTAGGATALDVDALGFGVGQ